jgi:hypothetical protein
MTLPRSAADVLKDHVTLEVEGIDRLYLNVYQPRLQTDRGVAAFFRFHRGESFASSALMDPISKSLILASQCPRFCGVAVILSGQPAMLHGCRCLLLLFSTAFRNNQVRIPRRGPRGVPLCQLPQPTDLILVCPDDNMLS